MARRKKGDKIDGWINLDKPLGLTSTQALGKVRRYLNAQKAGHAGTLDPLASGVLPIALGEATKTIPYMQDADKIYSFTVKWGEQTSTDDTEGEVLENSDVRPSKEQIITTLPKFIGEVEQLPPKFSAIKIDGKRAYDLARAGETVELKTRIVNIHDLELIEARANDADFRVHCGKGTYVRAIARDLGLELGTFGHVTALKREAVGGFTIENTISLDKLEQMGHIAALDEALLAVDSVLDDIPVLSLTTQEQALLRNGQPLSFISKGDFHRVEAILGNETVITALAICNDNPVGLVEINGPKVRPVRLFNL